MRNIEIDITANYVGAFDEFPQMGYQCPLCRANFGNFLFIGGTLIHQSGHGKDTLIAKCAPGDSIELEGRP